MQKGLAGVSAGVLGPDPSGPQAANPSQTHQTQLAKRDHDAKANASNSRYSRPAYDTGVFLNIDNVSVRYPRSALPKAAVDGVSLTLAAGQIGVLMGPSGCGKTSLLRAVAGLEMASAGRISVGERVLSDAAQGQHVAAEQRRIGMVFQDHALFPHLSVADNIAFGLHHQPRAQSQKRVAEMLALVGLKSEARSAPHELSGGQQQRVALARALAPAPSLLLLDEPFSSLDIELRERLAGDVRQILKSQGTTALVVTHDQMEAFAMADLLGVMHQGRLEQWDEAYTVYHRPNSRFVAHFLGRGVFAPGRVVQADRAAAPSAALPSQIDSTPAEAALTAHGPAVSASNSPRVQTALGDLQDGEASLQTHNYPGGDCDVLLRADDIVHDDRSPLKACIERKLFRGAEFLYTLRLHSGERVLCLVQSHHNHAVGEWIGIRAEVDHVVTFARLKANASG
jgi:iron(III) transport system ATP-binding protein